MNSMKLPELKALAKERSLNGYTTMKKQVLIDALSAHYQTPDPDMKLTELKALAKEYSLRLHGYSKMKKQVLIDALSAYQTPEPDNFDLNDLLSIFDDKNGPTPYTENFIPAQLTGDTHQHNHTGTSTKGSDNAHND